MEKPKPNMAEKTKSKSKTVVCALCDKPITDGKPVIIDEDPYHSDCAKAMSQSTEEADTEDEEEEDGEDESDDEAEDEEEEEEPAPVRTKKAAAPAKSTKRVVAEDDDDEDEDEEEEEEVVVRKPAAKKAAAKKAAVVEDDDDEDDEDEEEVRPAKKAVAKTNGKVAAKAPAKRAVVEDDDEEDEEFEEEEEPVAKPAKKAAAKTKAAPAKKAAAVDNSGWGNPAREGTKRYFVFQALHEVNKAGLREADGPGKPENVIKRAKRLHRDWAKANKQTLSEKDQDYSSMNVSWMHAHANELKLVMTANDELGTYRIVRAAASDDD